MSHTSDRLKLTGAHTDSLQITDLTPQQIEGEFLFDQNVSHLM